jgi:hypothetical protein
MSMEATMSEVGHSRPMRSVPVPIDVRCYSNSNIIVRRSEVTLRAKRRLSACVPLRSLRRRDSSDRQSAGDVTGSSDEQSSGTGHRSDKRANHNTFAGYSRRHSTAHSSHHRLVHKDTVGAPPTKPAATPAPTPQPQHPASVGFGTAATKATTLAAAIKRSRTYAYAPK